MKVAEKLNYMSRVTERKITKIKYISAQERVE